MSTRLNGDTSFEDVPPVPARVHETSQGYGVAGPAILGRLEEDEEVLRVGLVQVIRRVHPLTSLHGAPYLFEKDGRTWKRTAPLRGEGTLKNSIVAAITAARCR